MEDPSVLLNGMYIFGRTWLSLFSMRGSFYGMYRKKRHWLPHIKATGLLKRLVLTDTYIV